MVGTSLLHLICSVLVVTRVTRAVFVFLLFLDLEVFQTYVRLLFVWFVCCWLLRCFVWVCFSYGLFSLAVIVWHMWVSIFVTRWCFFEWLRSWESYPFQDLTWRTWRLVFCMNFLNHLIPEWLNWFNRIKEKSRAEIWRSMIRLTTSIFFLEMRLNI